MKKLNDYIQNTCKIGKGNDCCRYLTASAKGFECVKLSSLKTLLDRRVAEKSIVARGDNCPGMAEIPQ